MKLPNYNQTFRRDLNIIMVRDEICYQRPPSELNSIESIEYVEDYIFSNFHFKND